MRRLFFFVTKAFLRYLFSSGCLDMSDSLDFNGLLIWNCSSMILPCFRGFSVLVYNGLFFRRLYVSSSMVGWRFRFFSFSKLVGSSIHLRKKRGKSKRK